MVHICGKELPDDQHSCAGGAGFVTGLSRWMGCSDPQGSGRGRESINPAKMKLCPGCHNPFASSKTDSPTRISTLDLPVSLLCYGPIHEITCHLFLYAAPGAARRN